MYRRSEGGQKDGDRPRNLNIPRDFSPPGCRGETERAKGERGMVDGTMVFEVSYFELMRRARVHTALETAEAARGKGITSVHIYVCMYMYTYTYTHLTSVEDWRASERLFVKIIPEEKCLVFLASGCETARCNLCTYIYIIYTHTHVYIHMYTNGYSSLPR